MMFSLTQNIYICKSETLHIMKRPVVKIVPTFGEKIVEILVLMIVVCMMIFPYIIYDRLTEIIPSHINVRFCKTTCVLIFAYYTYKFALAALGLTITSFPVIILFIGLLFGLIYYLVKMSKC